jgi:hypothetical protein
MSIVVIGLLMASAGTAAADTGPVGDGTFTQNGMSAEVTSGACTSNGDDTTSCSDADLFVFVGKMSDDLSGVTHANQVCLSLSTYTFDDVTGEMVGDPTYESGCDVDLPKGAIRSGAKLASVTLAARTITIQQLVCDKSGDPCDQGPTRDVAVSGTWTGIGPIQSFKYRSSNDDGTCRYDDSGKGVSREATFVGSLAGLPFDNSAFAQLQDAKSTFRSRCSQV